MKVLVGKFVLEANANIPMKCDLENVDLRFGQECIDRLQLNQVFKNANIDMIPSVYADANSSGVMTRDAFDYIEKRFLKSIRENLDEIDGIYLHLHGASEVEGIGSGDHHLLQSIRDIVGPYLPIAIVCDPHGNLCESYVHNATIIRSYRQAPHTDIVETIHTVCTDLIQLLNHRQNIHAIYRKLPLLLGGEQSVSTDEPVRSINLQLDKEEEDSRILSCSWHVGYIRHDTDVAGAAIVVVPATANDFGYANEVADRLAKYVWNKRHEFHYTGRTAQPDSALKQVLTQSNRPAFLTDSGDNVTSGATGANTFVLRQVLALPNVQKKRFLFASIHDQYTYQKLSSHQVGDHVSIQLGRNDDELSAPVTLKVVVQHFGRQVGTKLFGENGDFGGCITVKVLNKPIDIVIADTNHPFVERMQFEAAGVNWDDYDVTIVKVGYAFPELQANDQFTIMSLTQGATLQDTAALPFKRIIRPIFPIDQI